MYCGDETGAFVGDIGSHTARFGYGGEDAPKVVVSSAAYSHSSSSADDNSTVVNAYRGNVRRGKYSAPVSLMRIPPNDCFISFSSDQSGSVGFVPIYQSMNSNPNQKQMQPQRDDGIIQDIDAWACLWEYSYSALCVRGKKKHTMGYKLPDEPEFETKTGEKTSQTLSSQSTLDGPIDHPLLAVDSTSRIIPTKAQEKQKALMLETLFESLSAPAAYIAPSAMLSSFAYGRQTALVVDIGHTGSRVTPLVDGYLLYNGSVRSGRGGRWLASVQQSVLEGSNNMAPFSGGATLDASNDVHMEEHDDDEHEDNGTCYVLPDGTRVDLARSSAGRDLCRLPELLFSEELPKSVAAQSNDTTMLPLHKLVQQSLSQILDADVRKELIGNIVLTGSASLFPGIDKRLSLELAHSLPSTYKNKVIASKNTVENRYGAWIGGSILSSLGSFQQLWLGKKEYEECGAVLGLQRFNN
ncbi:actin like protein [Thalassiosira pseudonana CCMP1335]|uniref:Actin like protein n=1 Tax=Thalassiosira pseudonana TaxID=35128 RepID=B8C614_THAPS|nr:actin like protein [Thalassiosira pseudonana CCMP1335]EED91214.1 actin like protein [Thalassiosira pseudonana CCMP1335]